MILNPQLAKAVRQAWIADQDHPHRDNDKRRAYPDENQLATVLDVAFRASLLNEEGKPIRGSLTLLSPEELATVEIPTRRESELVVRFSNQRQIDVNIVAKLAMGTEAGSSSLLVSWFGDVCKIWGIIYYAKPRTPLAEMPAHLPEGRHLPPDFPTIEITGAGSLRITRSGSVIGRIARGEFKAAVPTPFTSHAMGRFLFDLFDLPVDGKRFARKGDDLRWQTINSCLKYLLFSVDSRGGGATIIFVPATSDESVRRFAQTQWKSDGGLRIDELIKTRIHYRTQQKTNSANFGLATDKLLRQRLDGLAQLASLDGAVLLTPNFNLIGFGMKLDAPPFEGQVQEGQDGFGTSHGLMDFKQFGTRHNSALRFIAAVPGSIGFVASEDGPIRGLTKVAAEAVNCWPDCRLSMFV